MRIEPNDTFTRREIPIYTEDDLQSAVQAGALTAEAADALRSHAASRRATPMVDEEHFRLVTGFNDVFVVIACVLLLVSVAWIGGAAAHWVGGLAVAACAWGLAEFFVRKRHMALPAIVLLGAFVGSLFAAAYDLSNGSKIGAFAGCALAAAGAWLHWRRFQVPITVAAGSAALVGAAVAFLLNTYPALMSWVTWLILACGVAVFFVALRWDASDTVRQTRRADVAFWLHLLAAPLMVHPLFTWLSLSGDSTTVWQALAVLLAIGSALLLLSAFWHSTRAALLRRVPAGVQRYIAPLQ